ncbi:MAG TPA: hypothetical protein VFI31_23920 [Pirellulales bacterium]|nr:hypothetical protein [Pirellulales bacterium]
MSTPLPDAVFTPPADYEFEPELQGPAPREVPDEAWHGLYAQRRRRLFTGLTVSGVMSLGLSGVPFVNALAVYIVPLEYLSWIGAGLLAMAAFAMLKDRFTAGPYRYIREGQPLVARVVELVKAPALIVNGQASRYAFTAVIEFCDPLTGVIATYPAKSSDFIDKNAYQTSFRVGDYVTAVYLPNQYPTSLRLYAFLDLMPDLGLIRRQKGAEKKTVWSMLLGVVLIFGIFLGLFWNVYAYGRYEPIAFEHRLAMWPMIAGAVILGGAMFLGLWLHERRTQRRRHERNALAEAAGEAIEVGEASAFQQGGLHGWFLKIILPFGCLLLGAATALCWCFTINACLDTSASEMRPAIITNMTMTTHSFLFRHYDIEYTLPPDASKMKFLTTPEHMAQFAGPAAIAEIHQGYLGWPWVKNIRPAPADAANGQPRD